MFLIKSQFSLELPNVRAAASKILTIAAHVKRLALWMKPALLGQRRQQANPRFAPSDLPQDFDSIVVVLTGPAIARLSQAAERLQPLTAADISALESAADLQLAELTRSLRLHHAALSDRAAADRAVHAVIDLPQALRADVQATRGKTPGEGAA